ncbi:hypothetical protein YTPLAS73_05160 [Nitrosarchaeum sp.]|nr:hypothetical protein YTPLAS73_05160 [Nitrosarchaeum sp.]
MEFVLLAVTLSIVTLSITDFQNAEATKASGTYTQKYGSATSSYVCGDKLCSEVEHSESTKKHSEDKAKHSEDKAKHSEDKAKHSEDKAKHSEGKKNIFKC